MDLFGDDTDGPPTPAPGREKQVRPAPIPGPLRELSAEPPKQLYLGTSSWSFPSWKGLVWDDDFTESVLSQRGLNAYASHPLMRTVSLDRSFYRPLSASQYAAYAAQVPEHFRFMVKAPALVTNAVMRAPGGRSTQPNPAFLSADLASGDFVDPLLEGLGAKAGVLVFQLSPLPHVLLERPQDLLDQLAAMLAGLPALRPRAPDAVIAVEVRNPELLTPRFAQVLRAAGATYCLSLHARMPPVDEQLTLLRVQCGLRRWSADGASAATRGHGATSGPSRCTSHSTPWWTPIRPPAPRWRASLPAPQHGGLRRREQQGRGICAAVRHGAGPGGAVNISQTTSRLVTNSLI